MADLDTCENFLYVFKAAPRGRSRRRHGARAVTPAATPATARTNAGRLARKAGDFRAAVDRQQLPGAQPRGCPCSRCGIVQGRSEPVKAVCDRRATASVELPGGGTREDDLD